MIRCEAVLIPGNVTDSSHEDHFLSSHFHAISSRTLSQLPDLDPERPEISVLPRSDGDTSMKPEVVIGFDSGFDAFRVVQLHNTGPATD